MKAEEFRQYFSAKNNKSDLSHPIGLEGHKGFFKCLLCGNPHQRGVKYTIHQEEAIICPSCNQALYSGKRVRNLAEMKKLWD